MALKTVKLEAGAPQPDDDTQTSAPATSAPAAAPPRKRNFVLPIIGLIVVAGLAWFGVNWFLTGRFEISTDNAQIRADLTRVAPKVQGYVTKVHVVENQKVKAGELLISLEGADFQARVAQAQAALAQAEADAAQAKARISAQRDTLAEARAAREAADASADYTTSDTKRLSELADKGWYPKARVEQSVAAERTAKAQLQQAQAGVTSQQSQLASTVAAAQSADAKIAAAKAMLDAAQLDLGRTEIRAPADGVIANKNVIEGQLLSPNQQAMVIVTGTEAYVVANFKETQVAKMVPGQCVHMHVDAYPNMKVTGKVDSLSPATGATFSLMPQDTATGNFTKIVQRVPVRISLSKEALATGLMRAGIQVVATVSTKPNETCE
ncbi:MAG TPA: HlyD family secretion protein [Hyphomonadaceae bacterium]|jgi:membrane fusion protein (multidrug efflux system)|nr:HlyD family secretion protein [Hyphomonadaceae bacterium]